jgi:hypothetical protein
MKFSLGRKGVALDQIAAVGLTFVMIGVIFALGIYTNNTVGLALNNTQATGGYVISAPYAVALNATSGLSSMAAWLPIMAIVIAAGVVIAVLVGAFKFGGPGV